MTTVTFKGGPWDGRREVMRDPLPDDFYVAEWPEMDLRAVGEGGEPDNLYVPVKRHRYALRHAEGVWWVYVNESLLARGGAYG